MNKETAVNNQVGTRKKMLANQKSFFIAELSTMTLIYLSMLYVIIPEITKEETSGLIVGTLFTIIVFVTNLFLNDFEHGLKKIMSIHNFEKEK